MYLFMLQKGENNSQLFKRFNSRIFSSHQIVIAFSFFSLPQLLLLLPILISFSKTQANKKPKANIHEEQQGAWMREAGDSLDLTHFPSRSRSFPFPVLERNGESAIWPPVSVDWKCNFWLCDKFYWNKANSMPHGFTIMGFLTLLALRINSRKSTS